VAYQDGLQPRRPGKNYNLRQKTWWSSLHAAAICSNEKEESPQVISTKRRIFLKGTLAASTVAVAAGAGLLSPRQTLAAVWPKEAFQARQVSDALKGIFGNDQTEPSDKIEVNAPDIAENGAVVPITISSDMPNIESIALIAEKNGTPLAATFNLGANADGFVSTRIKMGETSNIIAVVKANGKVYSRSKEVKVTIGGCGG
jgi:sulfur-oxidizing protein SoxY